MHWGPRCCRATATRRRTCPAPSRRRLGLAPSTETPTHSVSRRAGERAPLAPRSRPCAPPRRALRPTGPLPIGSSSKKRLRERPSPAHSTATEAGGLSRCVECEAPNQMEVRANRARARADASIIQPARSSLRSLQITMVSHSHGPPIITVVARPADRKRARRRWRRASSYASRDTSDVCLDSVRTSNQSF